MVKLAGAGLARLVTTFGRANKNALHCPTDFALAAPGNLTLGSPVKSKKTHQQGASIHSVLTNSQFLAPFSLVAIVGEYPLNGESRDLRFIRGNRIWRVRPILRPLRGSFSLLDWDGNGG